MNFSTRRDGVGAALCVLALGFSSVALAGQRVEQAVDLPVAVDLDFTVSQCDNTGTTIDLEGVLLSGTVTAGVIFRNNAKGTKELIKVSEVEISFSPAGGEVVIPKQSVQDGGGVVGGNPHVAFQVFQSDGQVLSERVYLGRCVQDFRNGTEGVVSLASLLGVDIQAVQCTKKGSDLTVDIEAVTSGMYGTLFFDNTFAGVMDESGEAAPVTASATLKAEDVYTQRGWGVGGAGGNPYIFLALLDGNGEPIGEEVALGRCRDLL